MGGTVTKIGTVLRVDRFAKGDNSVRFQARVGVPNNFTGVGYTRGMEPSLQIVLDKVGASRDQERRVVLYEHELVALRDLLNTYFPNVEPTEAPAGPAPKVLVEMFEGVPTCVRAEEPIQVHVWDRDQQFEAEVSHELRTMPIVWPPAAVEVQS